VPPQQQLQALHQALTPATLPAPPPRRSVSYCPPAYYAHLAAFRGRLMFEHGDSSSEASGAGAPGQQSFLEVHKNLYKRMFYA
jgi:hypothetical protein